MKHFTFTIDNHLDRYGISHGKTIDWLIEYDDGTIEEKHEIIIEPNGV